VFCYVSAACAPAPERRLVAPDPRSSPQVSPVMLVPSVRHAGLTSIAVLFLLATLSTQGKDACSFPFPRLVQILAAARVVNNPDSIPSPRSRAHAPSFVPVGSQAVAAQSCWSRDLTTCGNIDNQMASSSSLMFNFLLKKGDGTPCTESCATAVAVTATLDGNAGALKDNTCSTGICYFQWNAGMTKVGNLLLVGTVGGTAVTTTVTFVPGEFNFRSCNATSVFDATERVYAAVLVDMKHSVDSDSPVFLQLIPV
jgi:hypothetical protein